MDFLDNYVFGPMNLINRISGWLHGAFYGDMGHTFKVKFSDRGGKHSVDEVEAMLKLYGIAYFGRTHDANHFYFKVKKRQAEWAEYIMLRADVALVGERFSANNAKVQPGKRPKPWAEKKAAKNGNWMDKLKAAEAWLDKL